MHAFLHKYKKKFPKFLNKYAKILKITKNTNTPPTLKINIVLNVQNIKKFKGFWDFPEWCG